MRSSIMMSFAKRLKPAPTLRPLLNTGCLMDIPTGTYHTGVHGESILNGGHAVLTGIGGRGNTYKSTVAHHIQLTILDRYIRSVWNMYDTEMSFGEKRAKALSTFKPRIKDAELVDEGRLLITDSTVYSGNKWFDEIKEYVEEKLKDKDSFGTLPFPDKHGKPMRSPLPSLALVDSLSRMTVDAVDAILDKNSVGESGNNMSAAKDAGSKHQMLIQMPALTARGGLYMTLTAHVDDELKLDPYAPNTKKLSFLKNQLKFKYVSNQYHFLMNNLWYCFDASAIKNSTTKASEYPRGPHDTDPANNDLMRVTIQNLRGKYGASGNPLELMVSQSQGVLVGLSEFHYIKSYKRYGLGGNDRNYYLELCPDISLSRTTVRTKINENPALQRGLEIASEMCQIRNLWLHLEDKYLIEPKELYENIKARGYDWDTLLTKTRGYWIFEEDAKDEPLMFLSTMDLLKMSQGEYHPYWYDAYAKKNGLPAVVPQAGPLDLAKAA